MLNAKLPRQYAYFFLKLPKAPAIISSQSKALLLSTALKTSAMPVAIPKAPPIPPATNSRKTARSTDTTSAANGQFGKFSSSQSEGNSEPATKIPRETEETSGQISDVFQAQKNKTYLPVIKKEEATEDETRVEAVEDDNSRVVNRRGRRC